MFMPCYAMFNLSMCELDSSLFVLDKSSSQTLAPCMHVLQVASKESPPLAVGAALTQAQVGIQLWTQLAPAYHLLSIMLQLLVMHALGVRVR